MGILSLICIALMPFFSDNLVVIYPDTGNAESVIEVLKENNLLSLRVMTYSQWLEDYGLLSYSVLCMRESGGWLYAQSISQKEAIREELLSMLRK